MIFPYQYLFITHTALGRHLAQCYFIYIDYIYILDFILRNWIIIINWKVFECDHKSVSSSQIDLRNLERWHALLCVGNGQEAHVWTETRHITREYVLTPSEAADIKTFVTIRGKAMSG